MKEVNIKVNADTKQAEANLDSLGNAADQTSQEMLGVADTAFTVAETITGSFAIATGAIGLFAGENERMQKIAAKANSVIAIALGVRQLAEQRLNIQILANTVATKLNAAANTATASVMRALGIAVNTTTASFKAMKIALVTTGVGALVIGLGFAIEKLMSFGKEQEKVNENTKDFSEEISRQTEVLSSLSDTNIQLSLTESEYAANVLLTQSSLDSKKGALEELNERLAESIVLNGRDSEQTKELQQQRQDQMNDIIETTRLLEEQTLTMERQMNFEENGLQAIADARAKNVDSAKMMFDSIGGLMKEGSKQQKAFALMSIATDTAGAISSLIGGTEKAALSAAAPFLGTPAYPFVYGSTKVGFYASGVAQILNNVAQAKAILQGGESGGGSVGGGGGGGGVTYTAPFVPETAEQGTPTVTGDGDGTPVQAYVVSTQMTNAQALDEELQLQSTL